MNICKDSLGYFSNAVPIKWNSLQHYFNKDKAPTSREKLVFPGRNSSFYYFNIPPQVQKPITIRLYAQLS